MNYEEQQLTNQVALDNPLPGDYWNERFCPYFLVLDVIGDDIYILCAFDKGPTKNAKISYSDGWGWDVTKYSVVNKKWIDNIVHYETCKKFVADVYRGTMSKTIEEWEAHISTLINKNIDIRPLHQEPVWFLGV